MLIECLCRDLQHQIKCHKDDGITRLSELEKTIKVLSGKSDLHKRVAGLSAELAALKTSEQKLQMDVQFYKDKATKAAESTKFAEEKLSAMQSHIHIPNSRRGKSELLVATMSEQIEKLAEENQRLEMLLKAAKEEYDRQRMELTSAHQRHEEQAGGLRLLAETHERRVTELTGEVVRLEEALRCRAARCKLLLAEESIVQARASVVDQVHSLTAMQAAKLAKAEQAVSDCRIQLEQAAIECDQWSSRYAQKEERATLLEKERSRMENAVRNAELEARDAEGRARQAQDLAQRENERLQINLSSASGQLTVLMETIDALQSSGKAEQQVAGLAAKISSAKVSHPNVLCDVGNL